MTELTQLPVDSPDLKWVRVICNLATLVPDGIDVDALPDWVTTGGRVVLTVNTTNSLLVIRVGDEPSRLTEVNQWNLTVQASTGELIDDQGRVGLTIPRSDSPGIDPQGWTIHAAIYFAGKIKPINVTCQALPTRGDVLNLVDAVQVGASAGTPTLASRLAVIENRLEYLPDGIEVVDASPTKPGVLRLATAAEVATSTAPTAITPAVLREYVTASLNEVATTVDEISTAATTAATDAATALRTVNENAASVSEAITAAGAAIATADAALTAAEEALRVQSADSAIALINSL